MRAGTAVVLDSRIPALDKLKEIEVDGKATNATVGAGMILDS